MKIASRIKKIRELDGKSQSEVAALLGISQQAYCGLEQEADNAKLETLRRFCRVMKIDLGFLISETMLITEATLNKFGRKNLTEIIYAYERMEHRIEVLEELQNHLQQMNSLN